MARIAKYTANQAYWQLYHNVRGLKTSYTDEDHDPGRYKRNYVLTPDRGISDYDYYREVMKDCYVFNRSDVKVLAGVIVTCPKELPIDKEDEFMRSCKEFLDGFIRDRGCDPAGVIQAVVHKDEAGKTHLHYMFSPIVKDDKHVQGKKICMKKILDRKAYRTFHDQLQRKVGDRYGVCLYDHRTRDQGGNRTVRELKEAGRSRWRDRSYTERNRWS